MYTKLVPALVIGLTFSSCGLRDKRQNAENTENNIPSSNATTGQINENSEVANLALGDAIDAIADSQSSSSETGLALAEAGASRDLHFSKTCTETESGAHVVIDRSFEANQKLDTRRFTMERSVSATVKKNRYWSKTGDELVTCFNERRADIPLTGDMTGYNLKVDVEKSKSVSSIGTNKINENTVSRSHSHSMTGNREINWDEQSTDDEGNTTRIITVSSDVTRNQKIESNRRNLEIEANIKTVDDNPLKLAKTFNSGELISAIIQSGGLSVTRTNKDTMAISFEELAFSFDESCVAESGSASIEFTDADGNTTRSFKVEVSEGELILTNLLTDEVVEDFDFDLCDIRDLKY